MVYPASLSKISLLNLFHQPESPSRWKMSRYRFFWIAFGAIFLYSWIPQYIAPSLQIVSVLCLLSPASNSVSQLLGSAKRGVGLLSLTFDWIYLGQAMIITPFKYSMNLLLGNVFYLWIVLPILFYTNAFRVDKSVFNHGSNTNDRVLNSVALFDRNGTRFPANTLYLEHSYDLNITAYESKAPVYISESFARKFFA